MKKLRFHLQLEKSDVRKNFLGIYNNIITFVYISHDCIYNILIYKIWIYFCMAV